MTRLMNVFGSLNRIFPKGGGVIHNVYFSFTVLALSIGVAMSIFWHSYKQSKNIAEQKFHLKSAEIVDAIKFRLLFYEQALWGTVGLFNTTEEVTREGFHNYVETLQIERHLPGIQGIGFSLPVIPEEKAAHIELIRQEGFPTYQIRPEEERSYYTSIIFLEPFDWRNQRAFGYDMWSNEMRRNAMQAAMLTGKAHNSGIITLVQETDQDVQRGFLMYLPVYEQGASLATEENRRLALKGWVYSPFRAGDLMNGILNEGDMDYKLEVYDGTDLSPESLLFDSDSMPHLADSSYQPTYDEVIELEIQGRKWSIYIHTLSHNLEEGENSMPIYTRFFAIIVNLLLIYVMLSLHWMRKKAQQLASDLESQKEDLEQANKELSQFAYITSHDLQEPLRTISNFAAILQEDYAAKLDLEGGRFVDTIINAASRMDNLINSILQYSQIGKKNKEFSLIDTENLLQEIENDMGGLIQENNALLLYQDLPEVFGNQGMIRQLFSNLISNAIKYRKQEIDPIIEITAKDSPRYVEFFVSDNGIGIEEQYYERIFQIFQRLHNKTLYAGTGIGLSSCQKIVEIHNGKIRVESEPGKGSSFSFTLQKK